MRHGAKYHIADSLVHHSLKVRNQIKTDSLPRIGKHHRVDSQHQNQYKQTRHHHFRNLLHTFLHTQRTDTKRYHHHQNHPQCERSRRTCHLLKFRRHIFSSHGTSCEIPFQTAETVIQHPSGHHSIEHHQQIITRYGKVTEMVPAAPLRFQFLKRSCAAFLTPPAHGKFTDHNGESQNSQKYQINQNKGGTPVTPAHIRKLPDISQSNGTSGGYQYKPQS